MPVCMELIGEHMGSTCEGSLTRSQIRFLYGAQTAPPPKKKNQQCDVINLKQAPM